MKESFSFVFIPHAVARSAGEPEQRSAARVLLLFCLYRVLCPRNYGQNGVSHGRRRRGDLPCDDYGYSPPVSEISPLLLRGHSMVGNTDIPRLSRTTL